jgi:hypothetical protein
MVEQLRSTYGDLAHATSQTARFSRTTISRRAWNGVRVGKIVRAAHLANNNTPDDFAHPTGGDWAQLPLNQL